MCQTFHYSLPHITVVKSFPQYRPSQYRLPPNTAAYFQVPNKSFVGFIWLPIPPISEYRRFFISPEIDGIGGAGDCSSLDIVNLLAD